MSSSVTCTESITMRAYSTFDRMRFVCSRNVVRSSKPSVWCVAIAVSPMTSLLIMLFKSSTRPRLSCWGRY